MKVIDILNKIANKEKVPEKIRYRGEYYIYDNYALDYYNKDDTMLFYTHNNYFLYEDIEVIEDKKIKKLKTEYSPDIEETIFYDEVDKPNHCILGDAGTKLLIDKINEIIDYISERKNEW